MTGPEASAAIDAKVEALGGWRGGDALDEAALADLLAEAAAFNAAKKAKR